VADRWPDSGRRGLVGSGLQASSGRQWTAWGGRRRAGPELERGGRSSSGARGGEPELGRGGRAAASRSWGRRRRFVDGGGDFVNDGGVIWNEQRREETRREKAVCRFFLARRQDLWRRARCHAGLPRHEARRHSLWRRASGPNVQIKFLGVQT
jgi:hypothetical protein